MLSDYYHKNSNKKPFPKALTLDKFKQMLSSKILNQAKISMSDKHDAYRKKQFRKTCQAVKARLDKKQHITQSHKNSQKMKF